MSRMEQTRTDRFKTALLLMAATGLIVGLAFYLAGLQELFPRSQRLWSKSSGALGVARWVSISLPRCQCRRRLSSARPWLRLSSQSCILEALSSKPSLRAVHVVR